MAFKILAMASNLLAIAMASNLLLAMAMASNLRLLSLAYLLLAMASNLLAVVVYLGRNIFNSFYCTA